MLWYHFVWQARRDILKIHTRLWTPPLSNSFVEELADKCVGKFASADAVEKCHWTLVY